MRTVIGSIDGAHPRVLGQQEAKMAILAKLAKSKGVDLADFLQPQEVAALETALTDKKKHAAAVVMIKNLEKQMDAAKAKKLKALLNDNFHLNF